MEKSRKCPALSGLMFYRKDKDTRVKRHTLGIMILALPCGVVVAFDELFNSESLSQVLSCTHNSDDMGFVYKLINQLVPRGLNSNVILFIVFIMCCIFKGLCDHHLVPKYHLQKSLGHDCWVCV